MGNNRLEDTFRRSHWEVMREVHGEKVRASFPWRLFWAWYFALPLEHVEGAIRILDWFGDKAKGVIASPVLPLLLEAVDDEFVNFFFVHWMPELPCMRIYANILTNISTVRVI